MSQEREHGCCAGAVERLYAYLDAELTEFDAATVREHLKGCRGCLDEYETDRLLKSLVRRSCSSESAPEHLALRIRTHLTILQSDAGVVPAEG